MPDPTDSTPTPTPTPTKPTKPAQSRVTFESARSELEDVVRRLEAGGISLEDSLALWERGEELARTCQEFLQGARARLDARRPENSDRA